MKSIPLFLVASCALFFTPALVSAEDTPAAPPVIVVSQTTPAVPAPPVTPAADAGQPARKEEDETAAMLNRVLLYGKGKAKVAANVEDLRKQVAALQDGPLAKEVAALTAQVKERDDKLTDLQAKFDDQTKLLNAMAAWLEENGHGTPQQVAADPAAAFQTAVGAGVANAVRKIGVPAATLKTAALNGNAATDEALEAAIEAMNAEGDPGKKGKLGCKVKTLREQLAKQGSN